jgi:PAS domain S-box-containing protein
MAFNQDPTTESARFSTWRQVLGQLFTVLVVGTGLMALKIMVLWGIVITGSAFMLPFVFIVLVLIGEVYGYASAQRILYLAVGFTVALAVVMWIAIQAPPGVIWPGEEGVQKAGMYAPYFEVVTAASILVAQSAMMWTLRHFGNAFAHNLWGRLFFLPFIAEVVAGPIKVFFCYFHYLSGPELLSILISRTVFGFFVGALTLAPLFALVRFVRHAENREALIYAVQHADVITEQQQARSAAIADAVSDGVMAIDEDSFIRYINPAGAALFGYTKDELMGKPLAVIQRPDDTEKHGFALSRYHGDGAQALLDYQPRNLMGLHRDGHLVPIEARFMHYRQNGRLFFSSVIRQRELEDVQESA